MLLLILIVLLVWGFVSWRRATPIQDGPERVLLTRIGWSLAVFVTVVVLAHNLANG